MQFSYVQTEETMRTQLFHQGKLHLTSADPDAPLGEIH
jgi:hypothetical protein